MQKIKDKASLLALYVQALDAAPWGEKVRARQQFTEAYNSGLAWPEIYSRLGDVHWKTMEGWLVKLKKSQRQAPPDQPNAARVLDCFLLADRRGLHRRGQCAITEEQAELFLRCVLRPNRPKISEAYRLACSVMRQRGMDNPHSEATWRRWLHRWRQRNHHIWVFAREGTKAWNDQCAMYIERDLNALRVGDVLVADGHALNFEILNPWTGKPQNHMVMLLFYDMAANMPLGWEIMPSENTAAITSALRRSLLMLGKYPKVVYLDNGRAFRAKFFSNSSNFAEEGLAGLYSRLGIRTIYAWPYHGQSKTVERFFGTFAELERLMPSYTGANIATRPAHLMRGERLHRRLHEKQFGGRCLTLSQAHTLIAAWFEEYAKRPQRGHLQGKSPAGVFAAGHGPGIDREMLIWMMMAREIKTIRRNGIYFQGRHYYHPELHGRREQVRIRYDFQDLSAIWVEDKDGELICRAEVVERVHPAAAHLGTAEDVARLQQAIAAKRAEERRASAAVRDLLREDIAPEVFAFEQLERFAQPVGLAQADHDNNGTSAGCSLPQVEHPRQSGAGGADGEAEDPTPPFRLPQPLRDSKASSAEDDVYHDENTSLYANNEFCATVARLRPDAQKGDDMISGSERKNNLIDDFARLSEPLRDSPPARPAPERAIATPRGLLNAEVLPDHQRNMAAIEHQQSGEKAKSMPDYAELDAKLARQEKEPDHLAATLASLPEADRYERLLELAARGQEIGEDWQGFMHYFEQTSSYKEFADYWEECRIKYHLLHDPGGQ